jgi:hypothetical protein
MGEQKMMIYDLIMPSNLSIGATLILHKINGRKYLNRNYGTKYDVLKDIANDMKLNSETANIYLSELKLKNLIIDSDLTTEKR